MLAVGLIGLIASASAQAATGTIQGNVSSKVTSLPAAGYQVDLYDAGMSPIASVCTE
jgi:hypothetical protein